MKSPSRGKRSHGGTRSSPRGFAARAGERAGKGAWAAAVKKIEAEIAAGRFAVGARLPTEAELSRMLEINRHSLRRAVDVLVKKGAVRRIPHVGTFVAPQRVTFEISAAATVMTGMVSSGLKRGHRLLSQRPCKPPVRIAKLLGVATRTDVIEVIHVSTANDAPFAYVTTWLPADRFERVGALMSTVGNVREALAQIGVGHGRRGAVHVAARQATPIEAQQLELPVNSGVLVVDSLSVDRSGEPTHVSQCVVDAGRVELVVPLS